MKRAFVAALAVIFTGAGCAEESASVFDNATSPSTAPATAPGSIAMRLVGTDAQGRPYWLRSATFTITPAGGGLDAGAGGITVSSEDDPDAETLSISLDPGSYEVTLQPGWYLEYQSASGLQRARNVRLTSQTTQPVAIAADQRAELIFRFAVDDSGRGTLGIGVEVETVDAGVDAGASVPDAGWVIDGGIDGGVGVELDAGEVDAAEADAGAPDAGDEVPEPDAGDEGAALDDAADIGPDGDSFGGDAEPPTPVD
ncbi:MAG: hypothetical protein ABW252_01425 [Polyangiales bacterium]